MDAMLWTACDITQCDVDSDSSDTVRSMVILDKI
jgi:hypothetical protein